MGVTSTVVREVYQGDGSTVTFNFPYYFFATTNLLVYLYNTTTGAITPQTLGTNYSVSGTQNAQGLYPSGANVVMGTAPPVETDIVIINASPEVQNYALGQNGIISTVPLVQQFDYVTLLIQRLNDLIARSVGVPDGVGVSFSPQLPANIATQPLTYLQVNAAGNGLQLAASPASWSVATIPYTALQTGSTTNVDSFFSLPAGNVLSALFIKHTIQFQGSGITDVTASIGVSGKASFLIQNFDLYQNVGDQVFDSVIANYLGSWANPTNINLTVTATGANLSNLSQGSVNVYYQYQPL